MDSVQDSSFISDFSSTTDVEELSRFSEFNYSENSDENICDWGASDSGDILLPKPALHAREEKKKKENKSKREIEEEEREKLQVLVSNFTEEQLDRYEMFRRAAFPKATIKRIMQTITGCSVSLTVVIAMAGIAKVFIGEVVEEALDAMEEAGESGPLQPKHLREAVRRLRTRPGTYINTMKQRRSLF